MKSVYIIAEAGVNHNGKVELAEALIDAAAAAGADAVKFQTFVSEQVISRHAPKAEYQKRTTGKGGSQLEMVKKLELGEADHGKLLARCRKRRISFLSTPFDPQSIDLLDRLGVDRFKVPSGEITNMPYLRKIGRLGKPVILSTGMATLGEVESALNVLAASGVSRKQVTLLHCNTEYPTPMRDVNLRAMATLADAFKVAVGYSDHTLGIEVPIAAVAMGAVVIEKHLTLDRGMDGPDHRSSLEPGDFANMVDAIRNIESALGDGVKRPSASEAKNIPIARKSIVALRDIRRGELFTGKNIGAKRPGTGISPMNWDQVIGRRAKRHFAADEIIET